MGFLEYLGWNGAEYTSGSPGKILFMLNIQVGMEQSILEVLHEEYYSS